MGKHALLSASSSHRWLACPPSAILCAQVKDTPTVYAQEGSEAHLLGEYKIGIKTGDCMVEDPRPTSTFLNDEMETCTDDYAEYVLFKYQEALSSDPSSTLLVESHLDFSEWVPNGFGTGDVVIVSNSVLSIIDFKYGAGVMVDAKENSQLMCYALGAIYGFGDLYDFDTIEMVIFQPRKENISQWSIARDELLAWAKDTLMPTAKMASVGQGQLQAGDHCRFCSVRNVCNERARYHMALTNYELLEADQLSDEDIEDILSKVDSLISWASDIRDYAQAKALQGKHWSQFKLVEGRSIRKFIDSDVVAQRVQAAGFDPFEHKLKGITAMEKMLGSQQFNTLLNDQITKPPGKPTLVPRSNKKPEIIFD